MGLVGDDQGMLKAWYRNAHNQVQLAGPIYLHDLPALGDAVTIMDTRGARPTNGVVTKRSWFHLLDEPDAMEVTIHIALDQQR